MKTVPCAATPDLFFPEVGCSPRPAKRICAECPSRNPCLELALRGGSELQGVWGGTTQTERRLMVGAKCRAS